MRTVGPLWAAAVHALPARAEGTMPFAYVTPILRGDELIR